MNDREEKQAQIKQVNDIIALIKTAKARLHRLSGREDYNRKRAKRDLEGALYWVREIAEDYIIAEKMEPNTDSSVKSS